MPTLDDRPMQIVTVSNVSPYKQQDMVIQAIAKLTSMPGCQAVNYRIVGHCDPEEKDRLEAIALSHGVSNRVTIEGRLSDEAVAEAYASSRCFVLMSLCESFGIPAIEAMTYGTPVVVADCCAMPEVCSDAAALVGPDNFDALVATLHAVLTDTEKAQAMRIAGAQRVAQFRWSATAERMAGILEKI